MGAFPPATLFGLMAGMASPEPYLPPGPYVMARGQSNKNRKARPDKKARRKRAAKSRNRNRR